IDQLLALPRRRFDEAASRLDRGLELTALNKRRAFERAAGQLRPDMLSARIAERRQRIGEHASRVDRIIERQLDRLQARLARTDAVLAGVPNRLMAETARGRERLANIVRRGDSAIDVFLRREKSAL